MSRRIQVILAGAALALSAASATAYAQAQSKDEPRRVEREVRIERHGDEVVRVERDGDRVVVRRGVEALADMQREHTEHLRALLQLRPNQEAALTAYLQAMHPVERVRTGGADDAQPAKTTPERLARMERRLAEHQQATKARLDATRRFYDQLDAAQKRAFDELPLMMGPMDGGGGRMIRTMHIGKMPHGQFGEHFGRRMERLPPMPPIPPTPPAPPRL